MSLPTRSALPGSVRERPIGRHRRRAGGHPLLHRQDARQRPWHPLGDPGRHAAYLNSWLEALRNDKHEIFRAARDAHKAADLLLVLEIHQSLDKALAEVNKPSAAKDLPPEPELKNAAALALNARSGAQVEL